MRKPACWCSKTISPHCVEQLRAACPSIERWVAIDGPTPAGRPHRTKTCSRTAGCERPELSSFDEDEIAELFYTSGSTGTPKGVMLSHRTMFIHALTVGAPAFNHDNSVELHTIPAVPRQRLGPAADRHHERHSSR